MQSDRQTDIRQIIVTFSQTCETLLKPDLKHFVTSIFSEVFRSLKITGKSQFVPCKVTLLNNHLHTFDWTSLQLQHSDVIRVKIVGRGGGYVESIEECNAIFRNIFKSCLSNRVGEYCNISFESYTLLSSGKKKSNGWWELVSLPSFPPCPMSISQNI
jgi:hypothetical protein